MLYPYYNSFVLIVNTLSHFFLILLSNKIYSTSEGGVDLDAKQRIRELLTQLNWSEYRLAIESGLSQSTVANIFNRNTTPSVATLEMICKGFGITLAQFFAEGSMIELTEEQQTMFEAWRTLSPEQKDAISHLISVMKK